MKQEAHSTSSGQAGSRKQETKSRHVVKRAGHTETFDAKKLYLSIYTTALAVNEPIPAAQLIAQEVTGHVEDWFKHKHEVTSHDIRHKAHERLKEVAPEAAYLYLHHKVVW